ncbi:uncharacterized protein JCM6883_006855 [Sporobolomyces salmoneus]|uniref:uncharacterized protein n=1 Tax=Sporobolomyces salmoneus TaxID=183962 RepID=UPI003174A667
MESTEQGASVFILSPRAAPSAVGRITDANLVPSSPLSPTALSCLTLDDPPNEMTGVPGTSVSNSTATTLDSPATVNILSLPPELILDIFEEAIPNPPFLNDREYKKRLSILSALALVHTSWTQAAQQLLIEVVVFQIDDDRAVVRGEERWEWAFSRAERLEALPHIKPKWLSITVGVEHVLECIDPEQRSEVQYLTLAGDDLGDPDEFSVQFFAQFTRLKALKLDCVDLVVSPIEPGLSFVHLRRLVLGNAVFLCNRASCQTVFSPTCMPNLALLGLDSIHIMDENTETLFETEDIFHFLLPQLTSFSISDLVSYNSPTALPALLYTPRKLSHLWISVEKDERWRGSDARNASRDPDATNAFSDDRAALLELESLHIAASEEDGERKLASRLMAIAKGQEKGLKVERIVVYGSEETRRDLEGCPDIHGMRNIEWRLGESLPVDFDAHSTTKTLDSPASVNILFLPPELILAIFDRAVPNPPFLNYREYRERLGTLSALALVHSSWAQAAQELLYDVIIIGGHDGDKIGSKVSKLKATETFLHAKTKWLSVVGNVDRAMNVLGFKRWSEVRYLHIPRCNLTPAPGFALSLDFQFLCASFPHAETLKLESKYLTIKNFEPGLSFIHLRRLVLGGHLDSTIYGDVSTCQIVFSPTSMPNLIHLSLCVKHSDRLRIPVLPEMRPCNPCF